MTTIDPYSMTDKLDEDTLDVILTRLEARGEHAFFQRVFDEYLDVMCIDSTQNVLDLGCGTGVAARAIAKRPGFRGKVTGIDLSPYLAEKAAQLANEEGIGEKTEFLAGDSRSLNLPESSFDAVVAHTLVSHVNDPQAVIKEAARIVKPGGMVGIFDGDYDSLTFGHDDPLKAKELDEAIINAMVTSPRVLRQTPRFLRNVGLEIVSTLPYVLVEVGKMDFWEPAIESLRKLLPKSGAMTEEEANAYADRLVLDSEQGVFFGACNFYSYVAKRP